MPAGGLGVLKNNEQLNGCYAYLCDIMTVIMNFNITTVDEILRQFAHRLRAQRLAQAIAQHDLALMAGLSLGAVRKLETDGQCSLETLIRVAQALGLVGELEPLFLQNPESIAAMQRAAKLQLRQRAPRRLRL